ncbi:MAG: hypothetical protein WDO68_27610 [Gammaproteobacteria bacterium]
MSKPILSRRLDRRAFLGGAGFAAGAVMATALVPLSIVHAVPAQAAVDLTPLSGDPSWNGHVDDAWGHWPPYAHDIPYNVVRAPESAAETFAANVDPADHFLMMI